jgi:predicted Zn-dependent protease with MMP-like domain
MTDEEFTHHVQQAVERLPEEFRSKLNNVAILTQDYPTPKQLGKVQRRSGKSRSMLLGLYEGIPQTKRGNSYGIGLTLPDRITIFKLPILHIARSHPELLMIIQDTVMHEIAHHFGMDEHEVRRAEASRRKRQKGL